MGIPSYGKIFNLGHRYLANLFDGEVVVQEKVDGSYFAFGVLNGELRCRSKGNILDQDAPDKMFVKAVAAVKELPLVPGWVYCGEYLQKPKHNTLAYDRHPRSHVILFDIEIEARTEKFLDHKLVDAEAARLGLETVPRFPTPDKGWNTLELQKCLENVSVLGGQKIEGLVIKNYNQFGIDGKTLRGKHVSEAFKEVHNGDWKARHPTQGDIKVDLANSLRTPARWNKAIQHLREADKLTDSPTDIGLLLKEINVDILAECEHEIKEQLFKWAWKDLSREITKGFPEYYKDLLMKKQFES